MALPTLFYFAKSLEISPEDAQNPDAPVPIFDLGNWRVDVEPSPLRLGVLQNQKKNLDNLAQHKIRFAAVVAHAEDVSILGQSPTWLYLPGDVCRQSDVLEAAAASGRPLLVERGAFLNPNDVPLLLEKLQGAEVALVECGSPFGYSDRVLDPRVLHLLSQTGVPYGIHLGELLAPHGHRYSWAPAWTETADFVGPLVNTAFTLGASFLVLPEPSSHRVDFDELEDQLADILSANI